MQNNLSPVVSGTCVTPYHVCSTIDLSKPWYCDDLNISQAWYDTSSVCDGMRYAMEVSMNTIDAVEAKSWFETDMDYFYDYEGEYDMTLGVSLAEVVQDIVRREESAKRMQHW